MTPNADGSEAAIDVDATPAIAGIAGQPTFGDVYYFFYVKRGHLYYRREMRTAAFPYERSERTNEYHGPDEWTWSAEREITEVPGGATQVDAADHVDGLGNRRVAVVYRDLAGQLRWFTIEPSPDGRSDTIANAGRLRIDAHNFAWSDPSGVELEASSGVVWLAYLRLGTLRTMELTRFLNWSAEETALDELGAPLQPTALGVGLAAGPGAELLMLMTAPDPLGDDRAGLLVLRQFDWSARTWNAIPTRLPPPPRFWMGYRTATEPAIAFRPVTDGSHAFGGWYELLFLWPTAVGTPLSEEIPQITMTDGTGTFMTNSVRLNNEWTHLQDDPHLGVTLVRALGDGEGILGAFEWADNTAFAGRVEFLPYADGVSTTTARDHDDPQAMRYGLCYGLRRYIDPATGEEVPRPECNPPLRKSRWIPTPQIRVICPAM